MTAVALPVTGADAPVDGARDQLAGAGFALYVGVQQATAADRATLAEVARAVLDLVAELVPHAETRQALALDDPATDAEPDSDDGSADSAGDLGGVPLVPGSSASQRARAAWRSTARRPHVVIDMAARQLTVAGEPVALTYKELSLLEYLVRASHRAVSREELLRTVWSTACSAEGTRTIDVHVRRLRKKLGGFVQIATVRGVGYRCDPTPEVVLVGSGDAG